MQFTFTKRLQEHYHRPTTDNLSSIYTYLAARSEYLLNKPIGYVASVSTSFIATQPPSSNLALTERLLEHECAFRSKIETKLAAANQEILYLQCRIANMEKPDTVGPLPMNKYKATKGKKSK